MAQQGSMPTSAGEWECMECGYVEKGARSQRRSECPECGAALEFFPDDEADDEWASSHLDLDAEDESDDVDDDDEDEDEDDEDDF